MKIGPLLAVALFALAGGGAIAEDSVFEKTCSNCHFEDDFADETKEEIEYMLIGIQEGTIKHNPPLADLSDEEIKKLAEFFASQ
jgi:cytochrome c553